MLGGVFACGGRHASSPSVAIRIAVDHDDDAADPKREIDRFERRFDLETVAVLDGWPTIIGGVRFVGATFWTDYRIDATG